jgi:ribosome-binding ATPase YchF (GTP1/OBG family)
LSVNEELHEHAEHAHDSFTRRAGAGMAIIAAGLAVVAVYGHITTTEELLSQQKAANQWAYYQAKALRRYQSDVAQDILRALSGEEAAKTAEKYKANAERYEKEGDQIQEKAKEYEVESDLMGRRALRFHVGEIFLELAIVFSSLAILSHRSIFFYVGITAAVVGVIVGASAALLH